MPHVLPQNHAVKIAKNHGSDPPQNHAVEIAQILCSPQKLWCENPLELYALDPPPKSYCENRPKIMTQILPKNHALKIA